MPGVFRLNIIDMINANLEKIEKKLRQGDWYRIAFLGDSITSAEWVHPNWREITEYVLKDKMETILGEWETPSWKIRCYNAGFNGGIDSVHVIVRIEPATLIEDIHHSSGEKNRDVRVVRRPQRVG